MFRAKCLRGKLLRFLDHRNRMTEIVKGLHGIDIQTQILDHMGFVPKMDGELKLMDERIFKDEIMGLE